MRNSRGLRRFIISFFASQKDTAEHIVRYIFDTFRRALRLIKMSLNSHIEWTDATWNPVRGCTKISPGCKHCYAETFAERSRGVRGMPYEQGSDSAVGS